KAKTGDHVLVYQTSASDAGLLPTLGQMPEYKFFIYGLKRNDQKSKKNAVPANCFVKEFSEQGFVDDLATSQAVVCNGGLSLIGEALYLGKPIMSVPVRNQFEQLMNARYLEKLGYGLSCESIDPQVLRL